MASAAVPPHRVETRYHADDDDDGGGGSSADSFIGSGVNDHPGQRARMQLELSKHTGGHVGNQKQSDTPRTQLKTLHNNNPRASLSDSFIGGAADVS
eukprot:COSAG06_NODE_1099_length_10711_cov_145.571711_3_plen_97_part_00